MKHVCDHCGTKVIIANVCAQCGRNHDQKWIDSAKENQRSENKLAILTFPGQLFIALYVDISLPFRHFFTELLTAIMYGVGISIVMIILHALYSRSTAKRQYS